MVSQQIGKMHFYIYSLIICLIFFFSSALQAQVYKCLSLDGTTSYSAKPCPGIKLDIEPSAQKTPPQGLRDTEKSLLRALQQQQTEADNKTTPNEQQSTAPNNPNRRQCAGLTLSALETFSYQQIYTEIDDFSGLLVRRRGQKHCAHADLRLRGYYGSLKNAVAKDLQERLYALLADGSTVSATSVELNAGPTRLGIEERFKISFCFAKTHAALIDVVCY